MYLQQYKIHSCSLEQSIQVTFIDDLTTCVSSIVKGSISPAILIYQDLEMILANLIQFQSV